MLESKRGSVLMEFIVVLPIYFLFIGTVFVFGELGLHSIQLAGGADRSYALSAEAFSKFKTASSPDKNPDVDNPLSYAGDGAGSERVSDYNNAHTRNMQWHWDSDFSGPWSKVVAATVSDYYTLTPLTRGFVAFWYRDNRRMIEDMGDSVSESSVLDEMIKDSGVVGRVHTDDGMGMTGRDRDVSDNRNYGYYTLTRNRIEDENHLTYRSWPANVLANDKNWKYVTEGGKTGDDGESFLEANPENPSDRSDLKSLSASSAMNGTPEMLKGLTMYKKDSMADSDLREWKK